MSNGTLTIDLDAVAANWRALDLLSAQQTETAAVVKANAYGLGVETVARKLLSIGVKTFFTATAEEGAAVRNIVGAQAQICIFSGHMAGDSELIAAHGLTPLLNSAEQIKRHLSASSPTSFGIQLDTGMNRLGIERGDWEAVKPDILATGPTLLMSHLACADEPSHPMNAKQLAEFQEMTSGLGIRRSLAATGGILLGPDFHFDLTRPGVGLYGGMPFADAVPALNLTLPVIQTRNLTSGEVVGYGGTWKAEGPSRIATLAAGYADGLIRALSGKAQVYAGDIPCPLAGRVSMDLLTVDVSHLPDVPESLDILNGIQTIDQLGEDAGTIGYEILTSLGARYERKYLGAGE